MSIISRRISILYVVGLTTSILYDEWAALLMQRSRYDKSVIAIAKTVIIKVFRVSYICIGIQRNWLLRKGHFGNYDTDAIKVSVITVLLTFKFCQS